VERGWKSIVDCWESIVDSIEHFLTEAERLRSRGEFEAAAEAYQRALSAAPASAAVLLAFGRLRLQQEEFEAAAALIGEALALEPSIPGGHAAMGLACERAFASPPDCAATHGDAPGDDPGVATSADIQPMFDAARALHKNGDAKEAEALYNEILGIDPRHADSLHNLAVLRIDAGAPADAIPLLNQSLQIRSDMTNGHYNLGLAHQALGEHQQAIAAFQHAIDRHPGHAEAMNCQGLSLLAQGRNADAVACFDRAIGVRPDYAEAHNNRGNAFLATHHIAGAIAEYHAAIANKPNDAEAHNNLGLALRMLGRNEAARAEFERVLSLSPAHPAARSNLGLALRGSGQYASAISSFERALELRPNHAPAWSNLGSALRETGRLNEARRAFERAVANAPTDTLYFRNLGETMRFEADDPYLTAMLKLAADEDRLTHGERVNLHFALGKAYSDLARHDDSLRHLLTANALKRRQLNYNEYAEFAIFDRIQQLYDPALFRRRSGVGDPSRVPVFIFGMPRSGTTLIEQILASHPAVFGAGELNAFEMALRQADGPNGNTQTSLDELPRASDAVTRQVGAAYIATIRSLAPDAALITDKMPANFTLAGAIHLALPNARIIHARRDPVDTCLSCFSQYFAGDMPFAYDLGELGRYHRAYTGLMAHWREVLPPGVMLEVDYEDVVADVEIAARRIVAHCGLDWHENCLNFHLTERPVRTASATAVRQPIYRDAVGRWRPYSPMLRPLLDALGVN
jgi:tetratricopeptide (TPR) repeat protein